MGDLCGYLGKTEGELFAAVDSAELSRWYARWSRIGFSDWQQAAMIASTAATAGLHQAFPMSNFLPIIKTEDKPMAQQPDEQKDLAQMVHLALGVPTQNHT